MGAFLVASRDGDFAALLAMLNPHIGLSADTAAITAGRERVSTAREYWRPRSEVTNAWRGYFTSKRKGPRQTTEQAGFHQFPGSAV